jgi:hypothetical protein
MLILKTSHPAAIGLLSAASGVEILLELQAPSSKVINYVIQKYHDMRVSTEKCILFQLYFCTLLILDLKKNNCASGNMEKKLGNREKVFLLHFFNINRSYTMYCDTCS